MAKCSIRDCSEQSKGAWRVLSKGTLALCYRFPMAIVGTGVDICEVGRVRDAIERFGERFLKRVFTEAERNYCDSKRNRNERYAARFAAKEAAMKAIGTGLRRGVSWQDFEVGREPGGRPTILIKGKGAEFAAKLGMKRAALSITHTKDQALAQVILES